jgi:predicted alpha/beta hydrolase family esterase
MAGATQLLSTGKREETFMTVKVLFIQGGGKEAHAWDARLVASLQEKLGPGYAVSYPEMPDEADPDYQAWKRRISEELNRLGDDTVLVGHSLGGSVLMKALAKGLITQRLKGVCLIAAPFFHEREGWQWHEAQLPAGPLDKLPTAAPVFLYHGREDEDVPIAHLSLYSKAFPGAVTRVLAGRNHQLNDDLTEVADDIRKL